MSRRDRLHETVETLVERTLELHDLALFVHRSEEILQTEGIGYVRLAHEAAGYLMDFRDRLALFAGCVHDVAHRLPEV